MRFEISMKMRPIDSQNVLREIFSCEIWSSVLILIVFSKIDMNKIARIFLVPEQKEMG